MLGTVNELWGEADRPFMRDDARETLASLARSYRVFLESHDLLNCRHPIFSIRALTGYRKTHPIPRLSSVASDESSELSDAPDVDESGDQTLVQDMDAPDAKGEKFDSDGDADGWGDILGNLEYVPLKGGTRLLPVKAVDVGLL